MHNLQAIHARYTKTCEAQIPVPSSGSFRNQTVDRFILLWQANCKISNNGLEWLLRFLFQFLHLVGMTCHCEYLVKFCTMLPTSLYVLRQLVNLDRDDFVKYVVCPNCSSLYDPGDCTQRIGGRIVAKCCVIHTKLLRKVKEQRNVEPGSQKELCCQMERNVFILLKCIVLTVW